MVPGATATVHTKRTSAGRTFPRRDGGEQEGRAERLEDGASSAPSSGDEKEGGPCVTASSAAVQPRTQSSSSLRSDAAAADDDDDDDGGSAAAAAGAGPAAKKPPRESTRQERHHQRQQHRNSLGGNESQTLGSRQTAAVTSADSVPSSTRPSKPRSNSLPSEGEMVAASTAGTVGGNDREHKRQRQESHPSRSSLPSRRSSARGGGDGGGDGRGGSRAGLETMAAGSIEPAEVREGRQIHNQRGDDDTVLEREVKRAKKSMETEHAVLLADRDSTISQLSG
ncbi:unnamed protein product, partial [Ectocarpus fasciculatus]